MCLLLLSTALAGPILASSPGTDAVSCETSERWQQLDESLLDLEAPIGHQVVPVTMGCRFMGVPGAIIDVDGSTHTRALQVVGMRRSDGQVLVAATPEQSRALRRMPAPAPATLVRDGDWGPMIEAMERIGR